MLLEPFSVNASLYDLHSTPRNVDTAMHKRHDSLMTWQLKPAVVGGVGTILQRTFSLSSAQT